MFYSMILKKQMNIITEKMIYLFLQWGQVANVFVNVLNMKIWN